MKSFDPRRVRRWLVWSLACLLVFVLCTVGPAWFNALVPEKARIQALIGLLWGMVGAYVAALLAAPLLTILAFRRVERQRRAGGPVSARAFGLLALGLSTLMGLALMEVGALLYRWHLVRLIPLPEPPVRRTLAQELPTTPGPPTQAPDEYVIVVLGESSATGEPFQGHTSVADILAWQLGRLVPGRRYVVDMKARAGIGLDLALSNLREIERRPDAVLLYSGHNEFQARFRWSRSVEHYRHAPILERWSLRQRFAAVSSTYFLLDRALERQRIAFAPPKEVTRSLVDVPTCSPAEYEEVVWYFERRLEQWLEYCHRFGAQPLAVSPAGNDTGWPPCRSVLDPETLPEDRTAFAKEFQAVRALETTKPAEAEARYRALIDAQPGFAESHFRLARLLEAREEYADAERHYVLARDLDGLPMRCPTSLLDVYRRVAAAHPELVFADGPKVLRRLSPNGLIGDNLILDGQHPSLRAYVALAQDLLDQVAERGLMGLPPGTKAPRIDTAECAEHFGIDAKTWGAAARRAASFYDRTATVRFDPSEARAKSNRLLEAAERLEAGIPPDEEGFPGLGVRPLKAPRKILNRR